MRTASSKAAIHSELANVTIGGEASEVPDPSLDRNPAEERPRAEPDCYTFEFWSPQATFGGHLALWRRPAEGVLWYATAVFREGYPVVALADAFPLKRTLELRGDGLWADHNVEDPFVHWSVGLEAFALALEDPTDERGERTPLGYDLDWDLDPDALVSLDDGYEQPARVHGEVLIGTEAYDLDGFGWRAHVGQRAIPTGVRRRHGMVEGRPSPSTEDAVVRPGDDAWGWSRAVTSFGTLRKALFRGDAGAGFTDTWQALP